MPKTAEQLGIKAPEGGFQDLGWYDGYQYKGGTFADARGVIHPDSPQVGAGQKVSEEVNRASAAEQGKSYPEFKAYLDGSNNLNRSGGTTSGGGASSLSGYSGSAGGGAAAGGGSSSYNVTEQYDKLYQDLGIDQLKSDVQAKADEITARRERLAEAQAFINENPFYAEATRTGKLRRLEEQAQADIANIEREQALLQAKVDEANQQLQVRSGLGLQQYELDRQAKADAVSELNTLLQSGANLAGLDIEAFSSRTGMSGQTIAALVAATEANEIKPSVIETTDDSGNVTVTVIDQNTGAIVGQTSLGRVGKATSSGSSKASESEIERYYLENLVADVSDWMGLRDVFRLYGTYIDPDTIYRVYNANSPYGPAKESYDELVKLGVKNPPISQ